MKCFDSKVEAQGLYQFQVHANHELKERRFDRVIFLLHGYSETGFKIYKRLGVKLDKLIGSNTLILAPNAPFPLPKAFPLSTNEARTKEELLQGFAWYFYHSATNEFLIDYKVPAQMLTNYITEVLALYATEQAPFQIIGYSQGGYLAPFLAQELVKSSLVPEKVIALNCSIRSDLLSEVPSYPLYQLQGTEDKIIDTKLAFERFEKLKERGLKEGEFQWIEGVDHFLKGDLTEACLKIATSPQ